MIERWIPLAMLALWTGVLRWRIAYHRHRFGTDPVLLGRVGDRWKRWRDRLGKSFFYVFAVEAVLVGLGYVDLASSDAQRLLGVVLGLGGTLLMLHAQLQMGASWRIGIDASSRAPLVTTGWYRFSRNPIYVFMITCYVGFALLVPNVVTFVCVAIVALGAYRQAAKEERWLREAYGDEYARYAARVGRFVPLVGRLRAE
jgi:protein-S-isoprenylcysteine O-methyltransferase Ste14